MDVLLICDVPDPREDPEWFDSADLVVMREAVLALCAWAVENDAAVGVPAVPAVMAFARDNLPPRLLRGYDPASLEWEPPPELMHAVLVGGMKRELAFARRVENASVPVWPMASTGAAALAFLDEFATDFTRPTALRLRADAVFRPLFTEILAL